jgi:hypothetical protein
MPQDRYKNEQKVAGEHRDMFGTKIELGSLLCWASYNELWYGKVTEITPKKVQAKSPQQDLQMFYPNPKKALVLTENIENQFLLHPLKG